MMRGAMRWLAAVIVAACSSEAPTPAKVATVAEASAAQNRAEPVKVYVDDVEVATVEPDALEARPRLAALVGDGPKLDAWTFVASRAEGRKRQAISDPDGRFPELEPGLFVDPATGRAAIGLFAREDPKGEPDKVLVGVFEVRISTKPPIDDAAAQTLMVVVDGKETPAAAMQLHLLPEISPPETDKASRRPGWDLAQVVALHAPLTDIAEVRLVDLDGATIEIPGDVLRAGDDTLWFKRNRQGRHRFKWFRGETEHANARAVVRIEIVTAS